MRNQQVTQFFGDVKNHFRTRNYRWWWKLKAAVPVFIVLIIIDVVTKQLAFHYLNHIGDAIYHGQANDPVRFLPGFINLQLILNRGVAFGSNQGNLAGNIVGAVCITVIALAFSLYFSQKGLVIGFVVICVGGFGNLIDRMWNHGFVVDFLAWELFPPKSIFNFADMCVTFGCVIIVVSIFYDLIYNYIHRNDDDTESVVVHSIEIPSQGDKTDVDDGDTTIVTLFSANQHQPKPKDDKTIKEKDKNG